MYFARFKRSTRMQLQLCFGNDECYGLHTEVEMKKSASASTSVDQADPEIWDRLAKNMLRAELMRRGWSYADLSDALLFLGVVDNEANLRNKVGRGRFSAVFLLQCLMALGVDWLKIPRADEVDTAARDAGQQLAARLENGPRGGRSGGGSPPRKRRATNPEG